MYNYRVLVLILKLLRRAIQWWYSFCNQLRLHQNNANRDSYTNSKICKLQGLRGPCRQDRKVIKFCMEVSIDKCKKIILGTVCFSKNLEKVGRLMHPNAHSSLCSIYAINCKCNPLVNEEHQPDLSFLVYVKKKATGTS